MVGAAGTLREVDVMGGEGGRGGAEWGGGWRTRGEMEDLGKDDRTRAEGINGGEKNGGEGRGGEKARLEKRGRTGATGRK